jgi:hypothetical protein
LAAQGLEAHGNPAPLLTGERRGAGGFQFIFSPSEAVNDVYDDGILHVVELLSVVVYDVNQPAWVR